MAKQEATSEQPHGELAIQTLAMPMYTNPNGDIFGGWLLSQMDLAGSTIAKHRSRSRVTTVAIEAMTFLKPVHVGDLVSCYCQLLRVGRTSMSIAVEAWTASHCSEEKIRVTTGTFTYVAINAEGKPHPVDRAADS